MESSCLRTVIIGLLLSAAALRPSGFICAVPNPAQCDFPAIFNFGDSNSDTGGLSAAFGQVPPPNGETFFHGQSGRYSDGRLVIDFAAESLRLPYLSAYLDSVGSNFSHGANFATAGSTVRPPNATKTQSGASPISLDVQSVQFSDFLRRSQTIRKRGGAFRELLPAEDYFSRGLYTFDIGQNDLTMGLKLNLTAEQVKAWVPDVLDQLSQAIKQVYGRGGRFFWVHNTGPLGCLPYSLDRFPVAPAQIDKYGCAGPINDLAQHYNKGLKEAVVKLRTEFPLASFTYVDVYSVKYQLISRVKENGFESPFLACCGKGGKYNFDNAFRCGAKITGDGKGIGTVGSCKNPSVRINWDGIHYTEAANKWVFGQIIDGKFSDPPTPLRLACQGKGH